ncbi:hypothetical protein PCA20602_04708 [Pandoraea capi]|uniref:Uncharacterized protein n=1 Tax=Pandoraea capi TaxID=2508286 RepID=A0ABY6WBP3_9BURK|nr:hypothetical protein [Pandoraea capi]VVE51094.1 hypothetical protein PCA20602_04708 [Pandoraea capi]
MTEVFSPRAIDCLFRASALLKEGGKASLLYAALELRMGIEGRLHDIKDANADIVKMRKGMWEIAKIGKNLDQAFRTGQKICEFSIQTTDRIYSVFFGPVGKDLRAIGMRLAACLHSAQNPKAYSDEWWHVLEADLRRGIELLSVSCACAVMGPPMLNAATRQMSMNIYPDIRDERSIEFVEVTKASGIGSVHNILIAYHDSLPEAANWLTPLVL